MVNIRWVWCGSYLEVLHKIANTVLVSIWIRVSY